MVKEWLEIAPRGRGFGGDSWPSLGGCGDCPGERVDRSAGGISLVCRRGALAEVSEPPSLPIRPFENAQIA